MEQKKKDLEFFEKELDLVKEGTASEESVYAKIKTEYSNQLLACEQAE